MAIVELKRLRKSYGATEIIKGIDLVINDRELTVFVGPSGCGKSTLLRLIAGLEEITSGELLIDGEKANDIAPAKRGLALVFQSYALYPHMSVAENMAFSLKLAGVRATERMKKVEEAARILHLETYLDRKPKDLSGGQRQRVAIGRAIVRNPRVFLFDEPLSNLDAALRVRMRLELTKLHRQLNATMIYVTHDQVEAMTMADKIVVLRDGVLEQAGSPMELYKSPINQFVAGFIGSPRMNFLKVRSKRANPETMSLLSMDGTPLDLTLPMPPGGAQEEMILGVRPEHFALRDAGGIPARIKMVERLGGESYLYVKTALGEDLVVRTDAEIEGSPEELVKLGLNPSLMYLFNTTGTTLTSPGSRIESPVKGARV